MTYNLQGIVNNTTSILSFAQGVNDVLLFGWLGNLLLIGIALVIFTSYMFKTQDGPKSLLGTAMITVIFAILFRAMSLVSDITIFICIIFAAGTLVAVNKN
jgi:hypothetical protein